MNDYKIPHIRVDSGVKVDSSPVQRPNGGTLDHLVREITARGNDVEVRTCREGLKVIEISKRVVGVFPTSD